MRRSIKTYVLSELEPGREQAASLPLPLPVCQQMHNRVFVEVQDSLKLAVKFPVKFRVIQHIQTQLQMKAQSW